jgi:hypothetical protein
MSQTLQSPSAIPENLSKILPASSSSDGRRNKKERQISVLDKLAQLPYLRVRLLKLAAAKELFFNFQKNPMSFCVTRGQNLWLDLNLSRSRRCIAMPKESGRKKRVGIAAKTSVSDADYDYPSLKNKRNITFPSVYQPRSRQSDIDFTVQLIASGTDSVRNRRLYRMIKPELFGGFITDRKRYMTAEGPTVFKYNWTDSAAWKYQYFLYNREEGDLTQFPDAAYALYKTIISNYLKEFGLRKKLPQTIRSKYLFPLLSLSFIGIPQMKRVFYNINKYSISRIFHIFGIYQTSVANQHELFLRFFLLRHSDDFYLDTKLFTQKFDWPGNDDFIMDQSLITSIFRYNYSNLENFRGFYTLRINLIVALYKILYERLVPLISTYYNVGYRRLWISCYKLYKNLILNLIQRLIITSRILLIYLMNLLRSLEMD